MFYFVLSYPVLSCVAYVHSILVYLLDNYYTAIFFIYGTALFLPKLQLKLYNCLVAANIVNYIYLSACHLLNKLVSQTMLNLKSHR